jgi:hypothetical protein
MKFLRNKAEIIYKWNVLMGMSPKHEILDISWKRKRERTTMQTAKSWSRLVVWRRKGSCRKTNLDSEGEDRQLKCT